MTIDVAAESPVVLDQMTMIGDEALSTLYASANSVHVLTHTSTTSHSTTGTPNNVHRISSFSIGDSGQIEFKSHGAVAGSIVDPTGIDESDGFLRVVSRSGVANSIYLNVLSLTSEEMELLSSVFITDDA